MRRLMLLITCAMLGGSAIAQEDRGYIVEVGEMAPNIDLIFPDGTKTRLHDLKGNVIMLQFTASWCGVCRQEMPFIEREIWLKHKNNPRFRLYGIDLMESKEVTAKFAADTRVTYPLLLDPEGKAFYSVAAKGAGVTRNVIIDATGKIVFLSRLFDKKEFAEMVNVINKLLQGA
ncbi:MAG: TlpA family protein disulfide reductase [Odoribacteraceae bacterium]|nr:TlpA family protein disulfide reductase [Odoribacteraceae bacterium]